MVISFSVLLCQPHLLIIEWIKLYRTVTFADVVVYVVNPVGQSVPLFARRLGTPDTVPGYT